MLAPSLGFHRFGEAARFTQLVDTLRASGVPTTTLTVGILLPLGGVTPQRCIRLPLSLRFLPLFALQSPLPLEFRLPGYGLTGECLQPGGPEVRLADPVGKGAEVGAGGDFLDSEDRIHCFTVGDEASFNLLLGCHDVSY